MAWPDPSNPLHRALCERGWLIARLARELGITRGAITLWGDRVPRERVERVAELLGVSARRLRPDLYPRRRRKRPLIGVEQHVGGDA